MDSTNLIPPSIGTYLYGLNSLGRMQRKFSAAVAIRTVPICRSIWYPSLLGGQRRCGFKTCPRLLHTAGIGPQSVISRVQRLNHSATRFTWRTHVQIIFVDMSGGLTSCKPIRWLNVSVIYLESHMLQFIVHFMTDLSRVQNLYLWLQEVFIYGTTWSYNLSYGT